jgi:triacylglycerol esterase/lipase EstA (alpha/beta hydrolase family)
MAISNEQVQSLLTEYSRLGPTPDPATRPATLSDLRRGRRLRRPPSRYALVERNGLLYWEWGSVISSSRRSGGLMRRASRRGAPGRRVIFSDEIPSYGVNQIGKMLLDFDCKRNPAIDTQTGWALRQFQPAIQDLGDPSPIPPEPGKLFVLVHGTASSASHIVNEIKQAPSGPQLLADIAKHYQAFLALEHPTVAFSPVLNAMDLASALLPYGDRDVDIVCHSRGGLVSSWWMNMVDRSARNKRCIFVGSPLGGTSLANPARLRGSLHLLANYGKLLGDLASASGFLTLPMTIIKAISSVVDFTASMPLLDAGLAMIPGLCAQSRIDNNPELARLSQRSMAKGGPPTQFYIQANFNSEDPGWKIWRYVTDDPLLRAADAAVDLFVFSGKNDLIVDMDAMGNLAGAPSLKYDGQNSQVHHTNYFRQAKTIDHIRTWFSIPV